MGPFFRPPMDVMELLCRLLFPVLHLCVRIMQVMCCPLCCLCSLFHKKPKYEEKKAAIVASVKKNRQSGDSMQLGGKKTTNLFRMRKESKAYKINVGEFNCPISLDAQAQVCHVEGMTTYEDLVAFTLKHGFMPTVVPELKSITIGGAVSGVGIESSSFKYGLVHETIVEMEVLLSDGRTVVCSAENEHKDLFFAMPNSYGTLGYALRITVRVVPVKKYVQVRHFRFNSPSSLFTEMEKVCNDCSNDFVDGVVFDEDELYITLGTFTDTAPYTSNYKDMNIYYKSIQQRNTDYLLTSDYIWRWDTDWFWCSRYFYMQNYLVRTAFALLGKLRSVTYMWIWRTYLGMGLYTQPREFVIQDVEIPIENCEQFLEFFHRDIGIKPVWMCPLTSYQPDRRYPLYAMKPNQLYINFGFWDTVEAKGEKDRANKLIEQEVTRLKGKKSLYSTVHYSEDEFWKNYNREEYTKVKAKYDSNGYLSTLYDKCVGRK